MTRAQVELLKRCIHAALTAEGHDDWLIEVTTYNSVDPRTARSLVDAGLIVTDMPSRAEAFTNTHVRLPRRDEIAESFKSWEEWLK